jgi:CyaY protein
MTLSLTEAEYRSLIQTTFDRIGLAFDGVDPDQAECEQALGAMTITLSDGSRCILSSQPSVRQLWLALASRGTAFHFNWDPARKQWWDDKGKGIELVSFLKQFFLESVRLELAL